MLPPFLNNPLVSVADKQSAMNRQMGVLTDDGQGKQGQLKGTGIGLRYLRQDDTLLNKKRVILVDLARTSLRPEPAVLEIDLKDPISCGPA